MPGIREAAEELSQREDEKEKLGKKFEEVTEIEKDSTIKEGFLTKEIRETVAGKTFVGVDGWLSGTKLPRE